MSTRRAPDYASHLSTLGVDPKALSLDARGTLVAPPPPLRQRVRLPVLRTEDTDGDPADVRLAKLLGEGGMGRVHAAEQVALGREVAVKVLRDDAPEGAPDALLREALIAGRLEHPNVVPVYLLGRTAEGAPLFVMRRIEGVPWSAVLKDLDAAPGMFAGARDALELHLEVFQEVCGAVQFAHSRGIVHRDLKPDNVMLGAFREVYVVDWGIAVSLGDDPQLPLASEARTIVGTPAYMAPEMAAADPAGLSPRTDVYLLGAVLHEVLTGRPPHAAPSLIATLAHAFTSPPPTFPPTVPADLAEVCRRAMHPDAEGRYASADELRRAVHECLRHRSSWSLSDEAARRALSLVAAIDAGAREGPEAARVQALFAECRFGFQQALAAWEGNAAAVQGLQSTLEAMAAFELSRDNPRVAAELLAQLPRPSPALAERVERATMEAAARAERVADLERFRADADVTLGATTRNRIGVAVGVPWCTASFVVGWLDRTDRWHFGCRDGVVASVLFAVTCSALVAWLRRNTPVNNVQSRFLSLLQLCGWGFVNHWVLCWSLGVSLHAALALYTLWLSGGWGLAGILYDRRFLGGSLALGVGTALIALAPAWRFELFGVAVLATYAAVLYPPRFVLRGGDGVAAPLE